MIFGMRMNAIFSSMGHDAGCGYRRKKKTLSFGMHPPERAWHYLGQFAPAPENWFQWMPPYLMQKHF